MEVYFLRAIFFLQQRAGCLSFGRLTILSGKMSVALVFCILLLAPGPASAKWIWAQQQNFKSLEKVEINSDLFLATFQKVSAEALQAERLVTSFYGSTFREFVFEVPDSMKESEVESIIKKVLSQVGEQFSKLNPRAPGNLNWPEWLKAGTEIGVGELPRLAFVNLKLKSFQMSYREWKGHALAMREQLLEISQKHEISWNELMEASRRYGRDPQAMKKWLGEKSLDSSVGNLLSEYGRYLTLSDFLDPQKYHLQENSIRRLQLNKAWDQLLVIDIRQMGTTNRISQDQWLMAGANIENIEEAAKKGDIRLAHIRSRIRNLMSQLPKGAVQGFYELGDSVVIGLKSEFSREMSLLVQKIKSDKDLHSALIERKAEPLQKVLDRSLSLLKAPEILSVVRSCQEVFQ